MLHETPAPERREAGDAGKSMTKWLSLKRQKGPSEILGTKMSATTIA